MKNLLLTFLIIALGAVSVQAQFNGEIDSTFAENGILLFDHNDLDNDDVIRVTRIGDDGKLYIGGYTDGQNRNILLARFNQDGSIDQTFGTSGSITYDPSLGGDDELFDLVLSDGKIIIFGVTTGANSQQLIARFNADGTLDNSFNGTGSVITGDSGWDMWSCGLVDQDGRIMAAGLSSDGDGQNLTLSRFNADGSIDDSFGANGSSILDYADFEGYIDIHQYAINRFYLSAIGDSGSSIIAISGTGYLVNGFGTAGRKIINPEANENETIYQIISQSNGDLTLIGESLAANLETDLLVVRLTSSGDYDNNFGIDGVFKADLASNENDYAVAGHFTEDGSILLGGYTEISGTGRMMTAMLASDGLLSAGYGTNGVMEYEVPGNAGQSNSGMCVAENGQIYLYGVSFQNQSQDIAIIRIKGESATTSTKTTYNPVTNVAAFPNPTSEQLMIALELDQATPVMVRLIDMNGRVMNQVDLGTLTSGSQKFDISSLIESSTTGMYILNIQSSQGAHNQKLMIR